MVQLLKIKQYNKAYVIWKCINHQQNTKGGSAKAVFRDFGKKDV